MAEKQRQDSPEAVIARRRQKLLLAEGYRSLFFRALLLFAVLWLGLTQVFLLAQNSGMDMFPAVKDGDLMLAFRLQGSYAKNDLVIYRAEGERRVGRIVARGGDVVTITEDGELLVNGTPQSGEILYPTYMREGQEALYPYRVPDGTVYILCDCRTQCTDSRDFGPVPVGELEGKVISILRRRGL